MSISEIMFEVEHQAVQLDCSRSVLSEAINYFTSIDDWKFLPHYAEHILNLLYAADHLLWEMQPKLEQAVEELSKQNKKCQEVKIA